MQRNDQKLLKAYYREIRSQLPCGIREKNRMMDKLRASVEDYLEAHPTADVAEIRAHFGEPRIIAGACVEEMESDALLNALCFRRKVVAIVSGSMLSLMLMWSVGVGLCVWDSHQDAQHLTEEIVCVIDDSILSE